MVSGGRMVVDSDCSLPISTLLCEEDGGCLEDESDDFRGIGLAYEAGMDLFGEESDDGYMEVLAAKERSFERRCGTATVGDGDWLSCARAEAVRWILKTRESFGFNFRTAYLSVTYLDRFFVKRTIVSRQSWAIQLLSAACLSIAAKMEERWVPALSEFQSDWCCFSSDAIQKMELLVLTTLEWRMGSVTPFSYLSCLVSKHDCMLQAKELLAKASQLIFAAIETAMNLVDYRASTLATAAFFAASGQGLTRQLLESDMGVISMCDSLEIEHVLSCYNLIQEMQKQELKFGKNSTLKNMSCSANPIDAPRAILMKQSHLP